MTLPHRPAMSASERGNNGIGALRRAIRAIERRHETLDERRRPLSFGAAAIDEVLDGGLACGVLHEIVARKSDVGAATGFVLALLARGQRAILWIAEDMAVLEGGAPYGPGLDDLGLAPERAILVRVPQGRDVPWAMEEALRCRAVGAVIGEVRGNARIGLVATRRLALAAAQGGAPALLLRLGGEMVASAAVTRWVVGAAVSAPQPHRPRTAATEAALTRNRRGPLGSWMVEWNRAEQRFDASAHPEPVAETALDRSPRADVA